MPVQLPPKPPCRVRELKLSGHVGFDSIPNQLVNENIRNGSSFNIMCIGETGLGKSTLMNTLFSARLKSTPSPHTLPNVKLQSHMYALQECGVRLKLTICETAGYGDQINKNDSFKAIVNYIDSQFEFYLQEELNMKRSLSTCHDGRIHVCLYFITPTGHGLKSLDLICMKILDTKVNIIPIIAKADTISKTELEHFKAKIIHELISNGIQIYQAPTDDESVSEINQSLNKHIPFAVVGSTEYINVGKNKIRAREYPWGRVEVENENHCDFVKLREMLIRTNMEDLCKQTHTKHYELYRRKRLEQMGFRDVDNNNKSVSFQQNIETIRTDLLATFQHHEDELRQKFVFRVKEKENELKAIEKEMFEKYAKMKQDLADKRGKLREATRILDENVLDFNRRQIMNLGKKNKK